jgi:hypothetical protein
MQAQSMELQKRRLTSPEDQLQHWQRKQPKAVRASILMLVKAAST